MKRGSPTLKTPEQVREEFARAGMSFTQWAIARRYSPNLVYLALKGDRQPKRGQLHRICVDLGLIHGGAIPAQNTPKRRAA